MAILVAGGAGFVGVNLLKKLITENEPLIVADNFSRGQENFLNSLDSDLIKVIKVDLADREECHKAFGYAQQFGDIREVWHLAANSDIPAGVEDSDIDFKDTFRTTFEILRCMKQFKVKTLHFASSSAIYGDLGDQVLHESIGPILPISNYGAMKLASEAIASAAAEAYLEKVNLFRFPNVVGVPATHGVILDFVNKLIVNPSQLNVLGDGTQQKSYLHVSDLVAAMLKIRELKNASKVEVINIGPVDDGVTVRWIAEKVVERVNSSAQIVFGTGNKGWVGDVPKFSYSTAKLQSYGWSPVLGSSQAILKAVDEIATQLGQ